MFRFCRHVKNKKQTDLFNKLQVREIKGRFLIDDGDYQVANSASSCKLNPI